VTSWNAKTPHSAWAMTLRRLLLAFGFVLVNQRSQWEEAHDAIAGSASTLKLEQVAHLYSLPRAQKKPFLRSFSDGRCVSRYSDVSGLCLVISACWPC
jgi:hypothetical protein